MDKNIILSNTRKADKAQVLPQAGNRITGVVTDASGEPIIGANVFEKGSTTNGTITDIDGRFTLEISSNGSLVVSYIGYQTQTVSVANRKDIKIQMKEDSELIEEVVVVGYGSQKKANLTGAVSNINVSDALQNRPIADVGRGLQGASSGLSVIVPSGEIGSDPLIKIRGQIGSIQGGSSPLILLDNVEIPSIQMVNPDDIETISVLKDAASSSIYGAKAAFGVILITTKKGAKTESVNISYSNNFSWQNVAKDMRMGDVDAMEYTVNAFERVGSTYVGALNWYVTRESWEKAKAWKEQYGNTIGADDPMTYGRDWEFDAATNRKYGYRTYDPYDYMIREWAPSQTHNLSLNGKSGKTSYNIGLGYLNQNGMMKPAKKDDFTRYNASIRLSTELNKYVTVRGGLLYSKRDKRYPYVTNATTADPWLYLYRWGPTMPIGYDDQGVALRGPASESSQANTANILNNYTNINIGATINITKDWTVDADYTYANEG
ncbi:MAG TPA: SusC/RagA family protein, partial [Porphyromonadaceae bacterium]|nr:SusC/RagA family protein [Porphyromonadaceae bacterium]